MDLKRKNGGDTVVDRSVDTNAVEPVIQMRTRKLVNLQNKANGRCSIRVL